MGDEPSGLRLTSGSRVTEPAAYLTDLGLGECTRLSELVDRRRRICDEHLCRGCIGPLAGAVVGIRVRGARAKLGDHPWRTRAGRRNALSRLGGFRCARGSRPRIGAALPNDQLLDGGGRGLGGLSVLTP